jgi:hypothetical protein
MWDKIEVLLGTPQGPTWELGNLVNLKGHDDNILGTHWRKRRKTKNNSPHPTPKRKKTWPILSAP